MRTAKVLSVLALVSALAACSSHSMSGDTGSADACTTCDADFGDSRDAFDAADVPSAIDAGDVTDGCVGTVCGGACVDLRSDPHHCGACATDCTSLPGVVASAVQCTAGACDVTGACASGRAHCGTDSSSGCETDVTTAAHCGSCSVACADPTPMCTSGGGSYACASGCAGSTPTRCGTSCVDTSGNPLNCGACDHVCTAPPNAYPTCIASVCGSLCNAGFHACGSDCLPNADVASCGARCTPCPAPAHGTASCTLGACAVACDAGYHACGGACLDDTSAASCGASCTPCPVPANGSATCVGGACVLSCNAGFHHCASGCVADDSATACGASCTSCGAPAHGVPACIAGSCGFTCDAGYHVCGGSCADDTSPLTCGSACSPCLTPVPRCAGNVIVVSMAPASCVSGACQYPTSMTTCPNGCYAATCTSPFTALAGTSAARTDTGSGVVLTTTCSNCTSGAGGPVPHTTSVTVTALTAPGGTVSSADVFWSLTPDYSSGSNMVSMTRVTSTASMDTWRAVIPAQTVGSEVYFYVRATPYSGAAAYDPNGFGIHYAYAVN